MAWKPRTARREHSTIGNTAALSLSLIVTLVLLAACSPDAAEQVDAAALPAEAPAPTAEALPAPPTLPPTDPEVAAEPSTPLLDEDTERLAEIAEREQRLAELEEAQDRRLEELARREEEIQRLEKAAAERAEPTAKTEQESEEKAEEEVVVASSASPSEPTGTTTSETTSGTKEPSEPSEEPSREVEIAEHSTVEPSAPSPPESASREESTTTVADAEDPLPTSWSGDQSWRTGESSTPAGSRARTEDWQAPREVDTEPIDISEHLEPGLELSITMTETLSSATQQVGDLFEAELSEDLYGNDGRVLLPAGTIVEGRVTEARKLRRVGGQAALGIEIERLIHAGRSYEIRASLLELGTNKKKDKFKIAGAAVAGAILGAVLGDGEGAAVGAAAGAAAGTARVAKKRGEDVEIAEGTELTLRLEEVVTTRTEFREVVPRR